MTPSEPTFFQRVRWPIFLVALLGGHMLIMMIGLASALSMPSSIVTPIDFEDALSWDDLQAARRTSEKLGWKFTATPSVMTELNGDRRVVFELKDSEGLPIENARLRVRLYHYAHADEAIDQELLAVSPGHYEAKLPMRRSGSWRLVANVTRGEEGFLSESNLWIAEVGGKQP